MVVGEDDGLVEGCTMERVMACRRRHKQGFWEIFLARKKPNEKVGELDICGWGALAGEDNEHRGEQERKRSEDPLTLISLGLGMILIYFVSPILNYSPLFLVIRGFL